MKKARLFIHLPLILVCLVVHGGFLSPPPAQAQGTFIWLGEPKLREWCVSKGGTRLSLQGNTAYSWHCIKADMTEIPVSVLEACQFTYADPQAVDRLGRFRNPYSWGCFTRAMFSETLTPTDFGNYCQSRGHPWVWYGATADTLRCISNSGRLVLQSITPVRVCQWKHPGMAVIDRVSDYFNPLSIQCWVGI